MSVLFITFCIILLAEIGDKTQLVSLALGIRGKALRVIIGVLLGASAVNLISVTLGNAFGKAVPLPYVQMLAGLLFLAFGFTYFRGNPNDESKAGQKDIAANPLKVAAMFFIAEIGDKTMLTTAALSAQHNPVTVWTGSTAALTTSAAIVVGFGTYFGRKLPIRTIRFAAATLFVIFGLITIGQAIFAL